MSCGYLVMSLTLLATAVPNKEEQLYRNMTISLSTTYMYEVRVFRKLVGVLEFPVCQ